jgi:hypothetical protein
MKRSFQNFGCHFIPSVLVRRAKNKSNRLLEFSLLMNEVPILAVLLQFFLGLFWVAFLVWGLIWLQVECFLI